MGMIGDGNDGRISVYRYVLLRRGEVDFVRIAKGLSWMQHWLRAQVQGVGEEIFERALFSLGLDHVFNGQVLGGVVAFVGNTDFALDPADRIALRAEMDLSINPLYETHGCYGCFKRRPGLDWQKGSCAWRGSGLQPAGQADLTRSRQIPSPMSLYYWNSKKYK